MSDNTQPPVPPQGSPVPPSDENATEQAAPQPLEEPSADHSTDHDASQDGAHQTGSAPEDASTTTPAAPFSPPAYDPNGYQQSLQDSSDSPASGQAPDDGQAPVFDQAQTYGQPQTSEQAPTYEQAPSYGQAPASDQGVSYGQAPTYGQAPGQPAAYGQPSAYGQTPGYAPAPAYDQTPGYGQGGYPQQAGGYPAAPGAVPGGYNPNYDPQAKSRVVAGILGILLGSFGVHRFYLGYTGMGFLMVGLYVFGLITSIFFVGLFLMAGVGIWALVEGILILTRSPNFQTDATGRPLRDG
jgi:TM2 domain-containing membrane protein YozV